MPQPAGGVVAHHVALAERGERAHGRARRQPAEQVRRPGEPRRVPRDGHRVDHLQPQGGGLLVEVHNAVRPGQGQPRRQPLAEVGPVDPRLGAPGHSALRDLAHLLGHEREERRPRPGLDDLDEEGVRRGRGAVPRRAAHPVAPRRGQRRWSYATSSAAHDRTSTSSLPSCSATRARRPAAPGSAGPSSPRPSLRASSWPADRGASGGPRQAGPSSRSPADRSPAVQPASSRTATDSPGSATVPSACSAPPLSSSTAPAAAGSSTSCGVAPRLAATATRPRCTTTQRACSS